MNEIVVMHLLQSDRFSGAENVVCQIIDTFSNDDKYRHVYCSTDGDIRESVEKRKITFYGLKDFGLAQIIKAINHINPDIIHSHDMHASFKAAICCGKRKLICHIHNNNYDSRKLTIKTILFYFAAQRASHIFWVSDSSYDSFYFKKKFRNKSSVLYNIIDIEALYDKMKSDCNTYDYDVVFLGRLSEAKNPRRLLEIFSKLSEARPNIKLAIIGTGELEELVLELYHKMELENNVEILGFQSNPYKMLHDSKVMLMTSKWEGMPMCSLEAMALGVPIVSTPTDGICRVVKNDKTGFLSNENEILTAKCLEIVDNPDLRQILSNNSIERIYSIMDLETYYKTIRDVYDKSL